MVISAKYFEKDCSASTTKMICLFEIDDACTREALYNRIWNYHFVGEGGEERQKNVIGIVSDGARNMISSGGDGACNRLKEKLIHITVTHDYDNIGVLRLLECLLGIVTSPLRKFENVKLTSTEIAEILQQL